MAEFKKMDSIANHPSAFRAQSSRTPLVTKGVKRSQSKANLQDSEQSRPKQDSPFKTVTTTTKIKTRTGGEPPSPAKRVRQHVDEDASSARPVSTETEASRLDPESAGKGPSAPRPQPKLRFACDADQVLSRPS